MDNEADKSPNKHYSHNVNNLNDANSIASPSLLYVNEGNSNNSNIYCNINVLNINSFGKRKISSQHTYTKYCSNDKNICSDELLQSEHQVIKTMIKPEIICKLFENILCHDGSKWLFTSSFLMFTQSVTMCQEIFKGSRRNILLEKFSQFSRVKIENISLPIFQYCFKQLNFNCYPITQNLMFKSMANVYIISGVINMYLIRRSINKIQVRILHKDCMQWLDKNDTKHSTIVYIPSAGVFLHPMIYYEWDNSIIHQPIDHSYLKIDVKMKMVGTNGWLKSFDYIYEIYRTVNTSEIVTGEIGRRTEICIPPNFWNPLVFVKKVKVKQSQLYARHERLIEFGRRWAHYSDTERRTVYSALVQLDTTNKKQCKCIVPYLLYKNMEYKNTVKYIDTGSMETGEMVVLKLFNNNNQGDKSSPSSSIVKITKINLKEHSMLKERLAQAMITLNKKLTCRHTIRKHDGQLGHMLALGEQSKRYDKEYPIDIYKNTALLMQNGLLPLLVKEYTKMFETVLPFETSIIKMYSKCYNEALPDEMGGSKGITKTMNVSRNLCNPAHFDACDLGISISLWTELHEGNATNWQFILPSCYCKEQGSEFDGIVVGLSHGAIISWDGKIRHCSTVGELTNNNEVFGWQVTNNYCHLESFLKNRNTLK